MAQHADIVTLGLAVEFKIGIIRIDDLTYYATVFTKNGNQYIGRTGQFSTWTGADGAAEDLAREWCEKQ